MKCNSSPYRFSQQSGILYAKSAQDASPFPVSNFIPTVLTVSRTGSSLCPANIIVQLCLQLNSQQTPAFSCSLSELHNMDYMQCDYRCRNYLGSDRVLNRLIARCIQDQVDCFDLTGKCYFERSGWTQYQDNHVYMAGNQLIGPQGFISPQEYMVSTELSRLRLDVDLSIKAKDTANYALQLMNLNGGVTTCAVLYYLYSLIQPLFLEAGWERNYVCLLLGPSQSRKTSLTALLSCIYNRQDTAQLPGVISLLSTPAAILDELGQYPDICRLVDDLYPSTSRAETRRREEKLSDIIRLVGNNASRGRVTGLSSVESGIPCGVICTAEYLPQGYSTLIRCLLLELEQPLPTRALTALQNSPLVWPTFIFRFLSWCAANYDRLVMHLKNKIQRYHQRRSEHPSTEERLREMQFTLLQTLEFFFQYALDTRVWCNCPQLEDLRSKLKSNVAQVLNHQTKRLETVKSAGDENRFSKAIAELYLNGSMVITRSAKRKFKEGYAAIEHHGCLCMRPDYLLSLLQDYFPDPNITLFQVTQELRRNGLLNMDASNRSTKKTSGVRSLHIYLEHLTNSFGAPDIFDRLPALSGPSSVSFHRDNRISLP